MKPSVLWEYRVESLGTFWSSPKDEEIQALLEQLGDEGWEVFSIASPPSSNKLRLVGRRPLAHAIRRRRTWPGE